MLAKYEKRKYIGEERVWAGRYRNLNNILHWHDELEIICVSSGSARVSVDNKVFEAKQGDCFLCESGDIHYINGEENSLVTVILFDGRLVSEFSKRYSLVSPLLTESYAVEDTYQTLKRELSERKPFFAMACANAVRALVGEIARKEQTVAYVENTNKQLAAYKLLLEEIDKNYAYFDFDSAAEYMGLSRQYFSKLFHKTTGMTFTQYVNSVKVQKAVDALQNTDAPVTEIASQCGFDTIRQFNRVFKQICGYSPTALPQGFKLNVNPVKTEETDFDPTLRKSQLL